MIRLHRVALYVTFAAVLGYLFYEQAINAFPSDAWTHLQIINPYIAGRFYIPHPAFHLSVYALSTLTDSSYAAASTIVCTSAVLATLLLVEQFLRSQGQVARRFSSPIALSLLIVSAIYLPWFNRNIYLGQFSPNIWHSPTMLLLRPFALVALILFGILQTGIPRSQVIACVSGSVALLISTVVKPSFVIVFLPAAGLYLLAFRAKEARLWLLTLLFASPSIAVLAWQYLRTYGSNGTDSYFHDKIVLTNFGLLRLYSPNVLLSMLLVLAFPLVVLAIGRKRVGQDRLLQLTWILTLVAFLQVAFLAEQRKFEQGAFGFGYVIALFLLYCASAKQYLGWFDDGGPEVTVWGKVIAGTIYLLHLASGAVYLLIQLLGGGYF